MRASEVELDHAFAEALESQALFRAWLLSEGRFARFSNALLLQQEQRAARPKAKHWWKHWWTRMPDGTEGETDIFCVWQTDELRFALHIENKPPHGKLSMAQAAAYRPRAALRANTPDWLSYTDFETILLAPKAFVEANPGPAQQFDRTLFYEDVGAFAPLFASCLALLKEPREG